MPGIGKEGEREETRVFTGFGKDTMGTNMYFDVCYAFLLCVLTATLDILSSGWGGFRQAATTRFSPSLSQRISIIGLEVCPFHRHFVQLRSHLTSCMFLIHTSERDRGHSNVRGWVSGLA